MANQFPGGLNNYVTGASSITLASAGHAAAHNALEAKIGTGASTPTSGTVLRGTGTGTSAWGGIALTTDVTGTLPVANGGTGVTASTGSGSVVLSTTPTLTTPVLGVATATSINKVILTAPATTATLTIANNKTLTISNILTLAGTDSTTITFQGTDTYIGRTTTDTLSNKRLTPRVTTITSSATPTINTDNCDFVTITALGLAITSMTTNLSGTPSNGDKLLFRIKDDGTARGITWGASFIARGATLPTTTVISKVLYVGFIWNSVASTWDCVASVNEA